MIDLFADKEELAQAAAALFADQARQKVVKNGRFSVLLAGGETPRHTYQILSREPYRSSIPWEKIHFFWGDERCVPRHDTHSNAERVQRDLLKPLEIKEEQIHRIDGSLAPQDAADAYQLELINFFAGAPPAFDLILLGLGEDGHTASLLPGSSALEETMRWTAVTHLPYESFSRVTLTVPILNQGQLVLFLVSGNSKAQVLAEILGTSERSSLYPAAAIHPLANDLRWYIDRQAAQFLLKDHIQP